MRKQAPRARLFVDSLESRIALAADALRLDIVAIHEFGHALGLHHHANPMSFMHDSYNAGYDLSLLANDPAIIVDETDPYLSLLELYSASQVASNGSPWLDALDLAPGNGVVEVTYSIMPDGTKINNDVNIINRAFDEQFGSGWRSILSGALNLLAGVSEGHISIIEWGDSGNPFNCDGKAQNDLYNGDIRIGAYKMDGPGGKLAESFLPIPIGTTTAPGDVFFDAWETWTGSNGSGGGSSGGGSGGGDAGGGSGGGSGGGDAGGPGGSGGSSTPPPGGGGTPGSNPTSDGGGLSPLTSAALASDSEPALVPLTSTPPQEQPKPSPAKPTAAAAPSTRSRNQATNLSGATKLGGKTAGKLSPLAAKNLGGLPFKPL